LFIFVVLCGVSALQAGWTLNGAPVCIAGGNQEIPQVIPDGEGGAFIVWNDHRTYTDIYAQRVDNMGRPQWTENGIVVCHWDEYQDRVQITSDGAGGFIAVWIDSREETHYDLYAQRVDSNGNTLWQAGGVAVSAAADDQDWPMICSDGASGCIIVWVDERTSFVNDDIYAQRIDADGNALWTADGIAVCTADSVQLEAQIVPDGSGGAVISWSDYRDDGDIYAQRLDSDGVALWAADGAPVCILQSSIQYQHRLATDGSGGAWVTWADRQSSSLDIRIQRIDASGAIRFAPAGITLCSYNETQREPEITADGSGGAIVVWEDFRNGSGNGDIYAQRIDRLGTILWTETNGEPICNSANIAYDPVIISDGDGGAIITWRDTRDAATTSNDVYAQRIDSDGVCLWHADGDALCTNASSQSEIVITSDGHGGAIVAWEDYRNGDDDIYAMRITNVGDFVGTALASFECSRVDDGFRLEWNVTGSCHPADFVISRQVIPGGAVDVMRGAPVTYDGYGFVFTDDSIEPGLKYSYRVDIVDDGERRLLFETDPVSIPVAALRLFQNAPNPFNPMTRIAWYLDVRSRVTLEIFGAAGRRIATLVDRVEDTGDHEITWNGTGTDGRQVASGIYLYRLTAGKRTLTRKMALLR
jgi:hypothetical protein